MRNRIDDIRKALSIPTNKVSIVLKHALEIALNLNDKEFQSWIEKELSGYKANDDVPDYREIHGDLKGHNPYHGWQIIDFEDKEEEKRISKAKLRQPISEIEDLIENRGKGSLLGIPVKGELKKTINDANDMDFEISLFFSPSQLAGILDRIRLILLKKVIENEKSLSFDPENQKKIEKKEFGIQKILAWLSLAGSALWVVKTLSPESFVGLVIAIGYLVSQAKINKSIRIVIVVALSLLFILLLLFLIF